MNASLQDIQKLSFWLTTKLRGQLNRKNILGKLRLKLTLWSRFYVTEDDINILSSRAKSPTLHVVSHVHLISRISYKLP